MDPLDWHDSLVRTLPEDIQADFLPAPDLDPQGFGVRPTIQPPLVWRGMVTEICHWGQENPVQIRYSVDFDPVTGFWPSKFCI